MIKIRMMQDEDFERSLILLTDFFEESLSEYGTSLSLDRITEVYHRIRHSSFVLLKDDLLIGILLGQLVKDFCSDELVYEEILWYVDKEYRKYGVKLFKYVQDWCRGQGIERMTMCCMYNSKTESLFKFYKKLGFEAMETRFIKQL